MMTSQAHHVKHELRHNDDILPSLRGNSSRHGARKQRRHNREVLAGARSCRRSQYHPENRVPEPIELELGSHMAMYDNQETYLTDLVDFLTDPALAS
jgi:hypothetical protein